MFIRKKNFKNNISIINLLTYVTLIINILKVNCQGCYDYNNKPIRCYPEFINAVFNRPVEVTNTCGEIESEYCVQTNIHGLSGDYADTRYERCDVCDSRRRDKSHPPDFLTDYNSQSNLTWWQSDSMEYNIQHPNSVNLTLHLGKSFDITYIQIKFHSPRPESFAIYKKTNESSDWIPYQFYSADCEEIYNRPAKELVTRENEAIALCTDEFSDIAPLSGGSVAFSTLEGRPNAYNFENSEVLKEWVTATDIKITLNRLNTFGDEVFGDPKVLRSYFYAISDISVGGRCKCNGHADQCITFQDKDFEEKYKCDCKHNTDGIDCEKCLPFYNDRPWAAASITDANECVPCNCNGLSNKCIFNATLYEQTGHGGYCIDCSRNTEGQNCENCKRGFYRREYDSECIDCQCHKEGSLSLQCDPFGRCKCKPGVTGDKCDRCLPNHYDLNSSGCKLCNCDPAGSFDSPPVCDPRDGKCRCKQNVEGQNCDKCKPGFFNLDANQTSGCLPCFCFGHSSECKSSTNHNSIDLESSLDNDNLIEWTATDSNGNSYFVGSDNSNGGIFVNTQDKDVWFNAPAQFLGNQRNSYNQDLTFKLKFNLGKTSMSRKDLVLENLNNGLQVYKSIYDSVTLNNQYYDPNEPVEQEFVFKLKETDSWRPALSFKDFQRLLSNLTSIKIKSNLGGYTFLNSFNLKTAQRVGKNSEVLTPAKWIEECTCPPSHTGQFCENCQIGFKRENQNGDSFTKCIPCACNNHSVSCDQLTGKCNCIHQTTGDNCETCKEGFYGDAIKGTPTDCKKCPCPDDGPCAEFFNYQSGSVEVVCLNCPIGTRGNLCDMCEDGYYETSRTASKLVCEKCKCNSNIDPNAVGNCEPIGGKCLKCVFNTTGFDCGECLPSYWGNALTDLKCHACECSKHGSQNTECNLNDGQCTCKKNVIGRQCDKCKETFWNLESGEGCQECKCNPLGSLSLTCDQHTGKCECRPGVTGVKCDECLPNHYGFSADGCKKCECDPFGSLEQNCNELGQCKCKENIAGDKCNKCAENYFNFTMGCKKCEDCYDLVNNAVTDLRKNISKLENSLNELIPDSTSVEATNKNKELQIKLESIKNQINELHGSLYKKDLLKSTYKESIKMIEELVSNLSADFKKLQKPFDLFELNLKKVTPLETKLNKSHADINLQLTMLSIMHQQHQTQLETIRNGNNEENQPIELTHNAAKLKNLARLSRDAAEEQENSARNFSSSASSYLKTTSESLNDIHELLGKFDRVQTEPDTDYEFLTKMSESLNKEAKEIKTEMDSTISSINELKSKLDSFKLSENDFDKEIRISAENIKKFNTLVSNSKQNLDNLNKNLKEYTESSQVDLLKTKKNLDLAKIKDGDLSQLLERSEKAKQKINDAYEISTKAYENATKMLETLQNFDQIFTSNKQKADQAENLRSDINTNIEESKSLNSNINGKVKDLVHVLQDARSLVEKLKVNTENPTKQLEHLINKSIELNKKTDNLTKSVDNLTSQHQDSLESIDSTVTKHNELPVKLEKLQKDAEKIVDNSQSLLNNVLNAEKDLESLENLNMSFKDLSSEGISRLEAKVNQVVRELDSFKYLDETLNDLKERFERSNEELKYYERELPQLKQQVLDLDKIHRSMCLA